MTPADVFIPEVEDPPRRRKGTDLNQPQPRPAPVINPTDPYRDNPAHKEILNLQQRLKATTAECAEWREAAEEARHIADDAVKTMRESMSRLATCGALSTVSGAYGGFLLGTNPRMSLLWLLGAAVASLPVASAVAFLVALRAAHRDP